MIRPLTAAARSPIVREQPAERRIPRSKLPRWIGSAALLAALAGACNGGGGEPTLEEDEPAPVTEGSSDPIEADGSADVAEPTRPENTEPVEPAEPADQPPPDLVDLMATIGFSDSSEIELAEFVYMPPGAIGQAGRFGTAEREVRVALVHYPNERYATPHVQDVQERMQVLPDANEAILHDGRTVIHIRAIDQATALAVYAELLTATGWAAEE